MYKNKVLATYRRRATTIKKMGVNKFIDSAEGFIERKKKIRHKVSMKTELTALKMELK